MLGEVDWDRVEDERIALQTLEEVPPADDAPIGSDRWLRAEAQRRYLLGDFNGAMEAWQAQPRNPLGLVEMSLVADLLAQRGESGVIAFIDQFQSFNPIEADVLLGTYLWKQGQARR